MQACQVVGQWLLPDLVTFKEDVSCVAKHWPCFTYSVRQTHFDNFWDLCHMGTLQANPDKLIFFSDGARLNTLMQHNCPWQTVALLTDNFEKGVQLNFQV